MADVDHVVTETLTVEAQEQALVLPAVTIVFAVGHDTHTYHIRPGSFQVIERRDW